MLTIQGKCVKATYSGFQEQTFTVCVPTYSGSLPWSAQRFHPMTLPEYRILKERGALFRDVRMHFNYSSMICFTLFDENCDTS
jgi:hypothetical protein